MTRLRMISYLEKSIADMELPLQIAEMTNEFVLIIPDSDTPGVNESGLYIKYELDVLSEDADKTIKDSIELLSKVPLRNGGKGIDLSVEIPHKWFRATIRASYERRMLDPRYQKDIPLISIKDLPEYNSLDSLYHIKDTGRYEEFRNLK